MTEFLLAEGFIGGSNKDISEDQFNKLLLSKRKIRLLWDVEEIFSLLAGAFVEFEEYLNSAAIKYYYQRDLTHDVDHFFDGVRQNTNLKLVAMLTASRVYEEQLHRRMSELSSLVSQEIDMKPSLSAAFDGSLEYRVMNALRNHALHNQLPLGTVTFSGSNLSETGKLGGDVPSRHRTTVDPKISTLEFIQSDKIRGATKDEVAALGFRYLDLKFFLRGFIASLASCHESARGTTQPFFEDALKDLQTAEEELREIKGKPPKFITIIKRLNGEKLEDHDIDYTNHSRLKDIRNLWMGLKWVQRGYISSEIVRNKETYPIEHKKIWIP